MLNKLGVSFVAVLALQPSLAAGSPVNDKPIFFRSYEYPSPTIEKYEIAGVYGVDEIPYAISLQLRDEQWEVRLESGRHSPIKVRLDKKYNNISVSRILTVAEPEQKRFVVLIPFGNPHSECFANGDDVYSQLSIGSDGRVRLEHFPKCAFEETSPPVSQSGGLLLVGPPPRVG